MDIDDAPNPHPRIEARPEVLVGKPVIAGTRIAVEFVLGLFAAGWTEAEILDNYPHLDAADVRACLSYAREVVSRERAEPSSPAPDA
jgi:uncharacterized protein (DUF433 family)